MCFLLTCIITNVCIPHLQRRMISIMTTCFNSVKHKLSPTNGFFDLLGFDFMLDEALNVSPPLTYTVTY